MTTYTDTNFVDLITPGEVFLVNTDLTYGERVDLLKENKFFGIEEVTVVPNPAMGMEDIAYAIGEIQKKSQTNIKTVFLIFDQMSLHAQNALLKTLEDIDMETCIFLYVSKQTTLLSTVISRVVGIDLIQQTEDRFTGVFISYKKLMEAEGMAKRLEMIKPIIKEYDEEKISRQDIISWISRLYAHAGKRESRTVFSEAIVMLQQPSVLVKYVLEYMASFVS